jgi:hypothetical protein
MAMKKKVFALTVAVAMCVGCMPLVAGCNVSCDYTLNYDDEGNMYYSVKCSGYSSSLKGDYEIPAYYGEGDRYAPVTEIEDQGFAGTSLTSISIPSTITKIGTAAFSYCYSLRSVEFDEDIAIDNISWGAFGFCTSLTSIVIPSSVTVVSGMAFYSCSYLEDVTLPDGLEGIGQQAFSGCTALKSISLPENLVTIGEQAFYRTGLTSVVIPDSVHDIDVPVVDEDGNEVLDEDGKVKTTVRYGLGGAAFHSCISLESVVVGEGVTTLKSGVFGYCTALVSIYLPKSLTSIEGAYYIDGSFMYGHAFHNDTALASVYFEGTSAEWDTLKANIVSEGVTEASVTYNNDAILNATVYFDQTK